MGIISVCTQQLCLFPAPFTGGNPRSANPTQPPVAITCRLSPSVQPLTANQVSKRASEAPSQVVGFPLPVFGRLRPLAPLDFEERPVQRFAQRVREHLVCFERVERPRQRLR